MRAGASGELGRDRRLAGPARTEQRHQPCPGQFLSEVGEHVVTADDRRQTVRDARDPALVVLARRLHRRRNGSQRRILGEDALFQLAQLRTRLETELVDQHAARHLERPQRLCLATLAILRRHQQRPPVLVDRFCDDECFELAARRVEVLVGPHLDRQPAGPDRPCNTFEAHTLAAAEVGVGDVVVRTAAHERLSGAQQTTGFGRVSVGIRRTPSEQVLELLHVDRVVGDGERVAPTVHLDLRRRDVSAQPRHLGLDRVRRGWTPRPQDVGEPLGRHGCWRGGDERRQQPPLLHAARGHVDAVAVTDDKWTEDFEPHRWVTLRETALDRHRQ